MMPMAEKQNADGIVPSLARLPLDEFIRVIRFILTYFLGILMNSNSLVPFDFIFTKEK